MSLFQFHKKKNNIEPMEEIDGLEEFLANPRIEDLIPVSLEMEPLFNRTKDQRKQYVENCCGQIVEANKNLEDAKMEYQMVTCYLTDIQIIESLPSEQKEEVIGLAKKIIVLEQDRNDFRNSEKKLSNRQYAYLQSQEESMGSILKSLYEDERYYQMVRQDMHHLEGEKGALTYDRNMLKGKIHSFHKVAKLGIVYVSALLLLLVLYGYMYQKQIDFLTLTLVSLSAAGAAYLFFSYRKAIYDLKVTEAKLNKAITLLNRIKLKYVNISSRLEYAYEKHMVHSAQELNHQFNLFQSMKKDREIYQKTSEKFYKANTELITLLQNYHLYDAGVWTSQTLALIEPREMVEIKHTLNVRRQKLRNTMNFNKDLIEKSKKNVLDLIRMNKTYADEILAIVDECGARLS